jgi:hypothetical protein
MDKTLHLRWWFVPAEQIPREEAAQVDWLYHWWETVDDWISTTRQREAAGGAS